MKLFVDTWQFCKLKCMEQDWLPSTWTRSWLAGKEFKVFKSYFKIKRKHAQAVHVLLAQENKNL